MLAATEIVVSTGTIVGIGAGIALVIFAGFAIRFLGRNRKYVGYLKTGASLAAILAIALYGVDRANKNHRANLQEEFPDQWLQFYDIFSEADNWESQLLTLEVFLRDIDNKGVGVGVGVELPKLPMKGFNKILSELSTTVLSEQDRRTRVAELLKPMIFVLPDGKEEEKTWEEIDAEEADWPATRRSTNIAAFECSNHTPMHWGCSIKKMRELSDSEGCKAWVVHKVDAGGPPIYPPLIRRNNEQ